MVNIFLTRVLTAFFIINGLMVPVLSNTDTTNIFRHVAQKDLETYPINPAYQALGEEYVAPQLQQKVHAIANKLGITKIPHVMQPLQKYCTDFPVFEYLVPVPQFGYLFINQEWFNQLDDDEQTYALGMQLYAMATYKQVELNKKIRAVALVIPQIIIAACIYKFAPEVLKANTKMHWSAILGSALLFELLVEPFANKKIDQMENNARLKHIATTLDCKQGGLSYLQKLQTELSQKYKRNKHYWKNLWEVIPGLIKALESL